MSERNPIGPGLTVDELHGGLGLMVVLDAPERSNALDAQTVASLDGNLTRAADEGKRVVAFSASGRTFCAGFDLSDLETSSDQALRQRFLDLDRVLERIRSAPFLTVACVDGPAIGAGADLVVACDHRIGTASSSFRFPGLRFGVLLGTHNLVDLVGPRRALKVLLGQKTLTQGAALRYGLLTQSCDPGAFAALVEELCAMTSWARQGDFEALLSVARGTDQDSADTLMSSLGDSGIRDRLIAYLDEKPRSRVRSLT